jgi:peptidyl-prolyl cis-trans isomerase D
MMSLFRRFAKSWVAAILMGLLIVSFGVWGISDVFHHRVSDAVIKAGSREISRTEFKTTFDRQLKRLSEENGNQPITAQQAVAQGFDKYLLQQLSLQEAMSELIRREGIRPSAELVVQELRKIPAFFNQVSGAFDETAYQQLLAQNGMTPTEFEKGLKDEIAEQHFTLGMTAGLRAPRTYAALIAGFTLQTRSADYFVVDPRQVGLPPQPTDAQLQTLLKAHEDQLRTPERRDLSLVRFSAAALAPTLTADPAEVQKRFDFEKDRLATPEERSFVEIPVKDAAQAAQALQRLNQGEDPAAVAKAVGAKPIVYAGASKASVADPKVADAVFALTQAGQTAGPIQGAFGLAVAKLQAITSAKAADLSAVRPKIEEEVRTAQAQDKVYDQVQKYDDARSTGAGMDQAAAKAGVKVYPLQGVAADGKGPDGQPIPALTQKMVQDAFSQPQGGETDVVDLGKGEYYALRVDKIAPAHVPPLEQLRPLLTRVWLQQELQKRIQDRADGLEARLKKGESLQAVAASAGATVQHASGVSRENAAQHQQDLGQGFLARMFDAKAGETFTAPMMTGMAVGKLTSIQNASPQEIGRLAEQARPQLTLQMMQNEYGQMIQDAARDRIKPKIDEALAREAIGVSPEEAPASGAPAGGANAPATKSPAP